MSQKGILAVISGFSGVGKGTVMKTLLSQHDEYALSISATTRQPRTGEENGREYFFKTREEFEEMIAQNQLLEHACYCGNYYGTPRPYVEQMLGEGKNVLLEIEIQGAMNIRKQFPDAVLIFIMPPSGEELAARLMGRGTETEDVVKARLQRAAQEAEGIEDYDYIFVNDTPEACAQRIDDLIRSQRFRTGNNLDFIEKIRSEVTRFRADNE